MIWYTVAAVVAYLSLAYTILPPLQQAFDRWLHQRHYHPKAPNPTLLGTTIPNVEPQQLVSFPAIPDAIERYAGSWSEKWVQDSIIERAKALYLEHGNWDVAYQELLKQDGEEK